MKLPFRILLFPFGIFYLIVVIVRNKFFDLGILKSKEFDIPIIGVGNLATGGTGKTPHTEYIAKLINNEFAPIAILSRGYKRKTKGFVIVNEKHNHFDVGDEAVQYRAKFDKNVIVAVDEKRKNGIQKLLSQYPDLKAIILDDSFQHRWVKPGLNILLTDFYKPFHKDYIFPFGNLREPKNNYKRADVIVVTKCNMGNIPILRKDLIEKIKPKQNQKIFFSKIAYGIKRTLKNKEFDEVKKQYSNIILFTGIANPYPLEEYLKAYCLRLTPLYFKDHHEFTKKEIEKILEIFNSDISTNKTLITTEKDYSRLKSKEFLELLSPYPLYYVPIEIQPIKQDTEKFNKTIIDYVRRNQKHS